MNGCILEEFFRFYMKYLYHFDTKPLWKSKHILSNSLISFINCSFYMTANRLCGAEAMAGIREQS